MNKEDELKEAKKLFTWETFIEFVFEPSNKITFTKSLLDVFLKNIDDFKRKNMLERERSQSYR